MSCDLRQQDGCTYTGALHPWIRSAVPWEIQEAAGARAQPSNFNGNWSHPNCMALRQSATCTTLVSRSSNASHCNVGSPTAAPHLGIHQNPAAQPGSTGATARVNYQAIANSHPNEMPEQEGSCLEPSDANCETTQLSRATSMGRGKGKSLSPQTERANPLTP